MNRDEFIALVEKKMGECGDIQSAPFGTDEAEGHIYLTATRSALQWALEMLPENIR